MAKTFGQTTHLECPPGHKFLAYMNRREWNELVYTNKVEGQMVYGEDGLPYPQGSGTCIQTQRLFPVFVPIADYHALQHAVFGSNREQIVPL